MCYTGLCKYENYEGECKGFRLGTYPEDAECIKSFTQEAEEEDNEQENSM